jgi:uncharacterized membrane protein (DUF2068 family)
MHKPELLILVAVWDFLVAAGAFIGIAAISVLGFPPAISLAYGPALVGVIFGLSVVVLILLAVLIISLMGGIGLMRGKEWGRALSLVTAALSLFSLPIGTAVGVLTIIYLSRADVRRYFSPAA